MKFTSSLQFKLDELDLISPSPVSSAGREPDEPFRRRVIDSLGPGEAGVELTAAPRRAVVSHLQGR